MRITVIGCGRVGSGLASRLAMDGHQVTVADDDPAAFGRLGPGFPGRVVAGSGLDRAVMEEAGVETADALAAVTGFDEVNAVVARLAAGRFRVPRVVARMYDQRQADLYRRLGILTISPVAWGIGRLSELVVLTEAATVTSLGGGQVDLMQVSVPPRLAGRPSSELEVPGEISVAALARGARTFIPGRGTALETGDVVYTVVAAGAAERLQRLLRGE